VIDRKRFATYREAMAWAGAQERAGRGASDIVWVD
jgi:hypothetical protein